MSVDHLLLPVCQCRRDLRRGLRLSDSSKKQQQHPACCSCGLDRRLARCHIGEAVGAQREKGGMGKRELCALSGRSGSRRAGSHLSVGPAATASSIRTQGVWRGSETKISLARCLAAATYCLLLAALLLADGGRMYVLCCPPTTTQHAMQELPLGCMIGRCAGTV